MEFTTYAERVGERKGITKGIKKGKLKGKQESLLQLLQIRFKKVPQSVTLKVSKLTDAALLTELFEAACRSDSLKEFKALLPTKG